MVTFLKLREWQEKAFPLWWEKKRGIIKVVTGGGKTFFAIHCIKEYLKTSPEKDVLIVVPSIALLDQWNEALSKNNINVEIVLNGGGEKVDKSAKHVGTVISGQMAAKHNDGTEQVFGPGDVYVIEPGHNGWVVGDEEVVAFEFNSTAAQTYAKTD